MKKVWTLTTLTHVFCVTDYCEAQQSDAKLVEGVPKGRGEAQQGDPHHDGHDDDDDNYW